MAKVEFPDTSYQGRETPKSDAPPEKNVQKVTTGNVTTKKKSELKKFAGVFAPEDTENVKKYILTDVVIPGIKNAIADVVSIMLFGETGRLGSRTKRSGGGGTSYQRFYEDARDRERRDYSRPRAGYEFDDILFETRGDAELVLDQLGELISIYGMASVGDLFDAAGETPPNYNARNYGWKDIRNARAAKVRDGYILILPKAVPLNN